MICRDDKYEPTAAKSILFQEDRWVTQMAMPLWTVSRGLQIGRQRGRTASEHSPENAEDILDTTRIAVDDKKKWQSSGSLR